MVTFPGCSHCTAAQHWGDPPWTGWAGWTEWAGQYGHGLGQLHADAAAAADRADGEPRDAAADDGQPHGATTHVQPRRDATTDHQQPTDERTHGGRSSQLKED